ncbi:glycosyltransferase family 2 protein [Desulfomicrobium salsuginis]
MGLKYICKRLCKGLSPNNLRSIFTKTDMPEPRFFAFDSTPSDMGDYIPGLVSFIVPTMYRKKTESLARLTHPLYTLRELLRDIHTNVTVPFEVIVVCNEVDNREYMEFVRASAHIVRSCQNSENVGVPRSWNMGAQLAKGEYLCFVNDDVEIGPGTVECMVGALASDSTIGMVGPAGALWYRQEPGPAVGLAQVEEADAICGWLFMTPQRVFVVSGGFDVAYTPALVEEIDYAFAVRSNGYKCVVIPGMNATHHHVSGASSSDLPLRAMGYSLSRDALTARNRSYFERKWQSFWEGKSRERF